MNGPFYTLLQIGVFLCLLSAYFMFMWFFSSSRAFLLVVVFPFFCVFGVLCCYPVINYRRMEFLFMVLTIYSIFFSGTTVFTLFSVVLFLIISVLFYIHYLSIFVFKSAAAAPTMHKFTNNPNIVFLYTVLILWILCMGLLLFYLFAYYSILINIHISNEKSFVMDPYLHSLGETYLSHEIQYFERKPSESESALLTSIAYYVQHPDAGVVSEKFETIAPSSATIETTTTMLTYLIGTYVKYFSLLLRLLDSLKKHCIELGELFVGLLLR